MSLLYYLAADLCHCYRQNKPFSLFHYTPLEYLRRIAFFHVDRLLSDYLTAVSDLVHIVDRSSGHLDTPFERLDVRPESVESVPAE